MLYLKDNSLVLSIVAAVREFDLETRLEAKREMLKLVFAFDHVNYARYNSYQQVLLTEEKRLNSPAYQDLKQYGYGASLSGSRFSGLHGDLVTELFNKGNRGPIQIRLWHRHAVCKYLGQNFAYTL